MLPNVLNSTRTLADCYTRRLFFFSLFEQVTMVVLRDVSCVPTENGTVPADCVSNIMDSFDVELTKKPGKGLGLSIVARKAGSGIFISDIVS